jgi:predicted CXXCH cytochrome family protein
MPVPRETPASITGAFQWTRHAACLLVSLTALSAGARAAQHPVPLGKNSDTASCTACHSDKATGKHVHSAIAMGCTTCHVVTQVKGVTDIKLVAPTRELCFSCHAKSSEKILHGPYAQGNCIVCHSPHSSNWPNQLLAPPQDLCMGCHVRSRLKVKVKQQTARVPWGVTLTLSQLKGWQYIGLNKRLNADHPVEGHPVSGPNTALGKGTPEINCLSCHQPHHSENVSLLPAKFASQTALCESCHKGEF